MLPAPLHAALGVGSEARHAASWSSRPKPAAPAGTFRDPTPALALLLDPSAEVTALAEELIHAELLDALPEDVVELVLARVPPSAPPVVRRRALRVLGAVGDARAIDGALALAESGGSKQEAAGAGDDLRRALAAILSRDPRAYDELEHLAYFASSSMLRSIAQATASVPAPEGLELLTGLLGWKDDADLALLVEIRRIASALGATGVGESARTHVRACLESPLVRVRGEAASLLGWLRDRASLDRLADLLRDEERLAREGAHRALIAISGAALPLDPDAWRAWLAAEREWLASSLDQVAADLVSSDRARAVRAIGTCSAHALFCDDVAPELAAALQNENPAVRRLACQALGRLGSQRAVAPLSEALADADDTVRTAAAAALDELAAPKPLSAK